MNATEERKIVFRPYCNGNQYGFLCGPQHEEDPKCVDDSNNEEFETLLETIFEKTNIPVEIGVAECDHLISNESNMDPEAAITASHNVLKRVFGARLVSFPFATY